MEHAKKRNPENPEKDYWHLIQKMRMEHKGKVKESSKARPEHTGEKRYYSFI